MIDIGKTLFHVPLRILRLRKASLAVQPMSIPGQQNPPAQALKFRIVSYHFHQPLAQPLTTVIFQDEHVTNVGKGSKIGDNPGEADLLTFLIHTKS